MKIKVCGMRDHFNIQEVAALKPDLMGFIFYPKSKRFVGTVLNSGQVKSLRPEIQTVGVFVNEKEEIIHSLLNRYQFDMVQLSGDESPEFCRAIRKKSLVLKAFGIHEQFQWNMLETYTGVCDYFLFDTRSKGYGGSGMKFNWQILDNYKLHHPFFLSGGIGPDDVSGILESQNPYLKGIDVNSKFESEPGIKKTELLHRFLSEIRSGII